MMNIGMLMILYSNKRMHSKTLNYTNKKKPRLLIVIEALMKKGSYLLSHIALQYHRRNWA